MEQGTAQSSRSVMSAALINVKGIPAGLGRVRELALQNRAYDCLKPYPFFHFGDWDTNERGPHPRCLPLFQTIVKRGALWLFGKPLELHCAGNPTLEKYLRQAWLDNRMPSRLRAIAEKAGKETGVALKFSLDETKKPALRIQTLSLFDEVQFFTHPHDREDVLMVRIQYRYFDAAKQKHFWYREEWTDAEEIHYYPLEETANIDKNFNPDTCDEWQIETRAENPFGLIPVHLCRNLDINDYWGAADLWSLIIEDGLFRVFDRVNLSYHLMDRSNQFDSSINPFIIDGEPAEGEEDKALVPNQSQHVESTDTTGAKQAQVIFPPSGNDLRPHITEYADALRQALCEATNTVLTRPDEITNKGNLTPAVLKTIYAPQIDITLEKRKSMGDDGIATFLSKAAQGLKNAGVKLAVTDDEASHHIELGWTDFFEASSEELAAETDRAVTQVANRFLPPERAVERIAKKEGIKDVEQLQREIAALPKPKEESNDQSNAGE